ncbi:MAG: hypothetical protein ACP6IP_08920 [Candidatus Njordarchaeia archaeon]
MNKKVLLEIIWVVDNLSPNVGLILLEEYQKQGKTDLNDEVMIIQHTNEIIRERNLLDEKMKLKGYSDLSTLLRQTLGRLDFEIPDDLKLYIYGSHLVVEKINTETSFEKKLEALCSLFYFPLGTIIDLRGSETYIDMPNGSKLVYPHDPVTALINVQEEGFDLYPYLRKMFDDKLSALRLLLGREKINHLYELCGSRVRKHVT